MNPITTLAYIAPYMAFIQALPRDTLEDYYVVTTIENYTNEHYVYFQKVLTAIAQRHHAKTGNHNFEYQSKLFLFDNYEFSFDPLHTSLKDSMQAYTSQCVDYTRDLNQLSVYLRQVLNLGKTYSRVQQLIFPELKPFQEGAALDNTVHHDDVLSDEEVNAFKQKYESIRQAIKVHTLRRALQ